MAKVRDIQAARLMKKSFVLKKVKLVVSIVFIITGLVMGAIPVLGPILTQRHHDKVIQNYKNEIASMSQEEISYAKGEVKKYNETGKSNYYAAIDAGQVISYIEIPSIDVYLPIFKGTSDKTLERGIGLLEETSFPIGGKGTHCVLSGHSGLLTQKMFSNLKDMETGDRFYLHTYDETLCYKVYKTVVVNTDEVSDYIQFDTEHDYCTLLTCTPIGVNTHRLLVMGERVEIEEDNISPTQEITEKTTDNIQTLNQKITPKNEDNANSDNTYRIEFIICVAISCLL